MARSRRPELEKDNPVAPQMYVRQRKRRAAPAEVSPSHQQAVLSETLQTLADAAERFLSGVPRWKRVEPARTALLDAITQAQLILSVERVPAPPPLP